jgi:hypothetical protein
MNKIKISLIVPNYIQYFDEWTYDAFIISQNSEINHAGKSC